MFYPEEEMVFSRDKIEVFTQETDVLKTEVDVSRYKLLHALNSFVYTKKEEGTTLAKKSSYKRRTVSNRNRIHVERRCIKPPKGYAFMILYGSPDEKYGPSAYRLLRVQDNPLDHVCTSVHLIPLNQLYILYNAVRSSEPTEKTVKVSITLSQYLTI